MTVAPELPPAAADRRAAGGVVPSAWAAGGSVPPAGAAGGAVPSARAAGGSVPSARAAGGAATSARAAGGSVPSARAAGGSVPFARAAGAVVQSAGTAGGVVPSAPAADGVVPAARRRAAAAHATGAVVLRPTGRRPAAPLAVPDHRPAPPAGRGTAPADRVAAGRVAAGRVAGRIHRTAIRVAPPRMPSRPDLVPTPPARTAPEEGAPGGTGSADAWSGRALLDWRRDSRPGAGTAGPHHPAVPGRLRAAGVRVVRPAAPPLRLTVRGRLLVTLLAGLTVLMGLLAVTARVDAIREPAAPVPASAPASVVVQPGESLWTIAERVAPGRDPRVVVDQLRRINQLPSGDVAAGRRILLRAP